MSVAKLVLNGDTSGAVSLQVPDVAGTNTITIPAVTGTALVGSAVSTSIVSVVTNKIAININGTTYYLLASTSGT